MVICIMAKIIVILGKSASGKNKVYSRLLDEFKVKPIVTFTTRPPRAGEIYGIDYFFIDNKEMFNGIQNGDIFEYRVYNTSSGVWCYGTNRKSIDMESNNIYVSILDVEGLKAYIKEFGAENVYSYYIEADDTIRLIRMLDREVNFNDTKKCELIRRYYVDEENFINVKQYCSDVGVNNTLEDLDRIIDSIKYKIDTWNIA